jgi:hypothetical protein
MTQSDVDSVAAVLKDKLPPGSDFSVRHSHWRSSWGTHRTLVVEFSSRGVSIKAEVERWEDLRERPGFSEMFRDSPIGQSLSTTPAP